jgi:hypothetical protein
VRDHRAADGHRRAEVDQPAPLLDVQLEEPPDPAEPLVVRPHPRRVDTGLRRRLGEGHAVGVPQAACLVGVDRAGQQPRAQAGHTEPAALLFREDDNGDRLAWPEPLGLQRLHRGQRARDTERAVERAATRHRVEVAAGDHGVAPRRPPPRPDVAVAVGLDVQPEPQRAVDEPRAQVVLRRVEGVA